MKLLGVFLLWRASKHIIYLQCYLTIGLMSYLVERTSSCPLSLMKNWSADFSLTISTAFPKKSSATQPQPLVLSLFSTKYVSSFVSLFVG